MTITLYGSPLSLYTGRARSYLIKAGLDYREVTATTRHYLEQVLPKAGNRQGIPTLETADGEVIRDGAAIIDFFEKTSGHTFSPATPCQQVISRLFDVIGAEGLLRPAMHYRWNFPEENLAFLHFHFTTNVPPMPNREQVAEGAMDRMRGAGHAFGAVPDTFALVESLYERLLDRLDAHFAAHPYLLGGRPCIGDFGMIAPLYAHLGRDPKPLALMQSRAIRLFRWVERMNRPEPDIGEFEDRADAYLADDEIPDTLIDVLKHMAIDFVPETRAAAALINDWIDQQDDLTGKAAERGVGLAQFEVEGSKINALAQPYRFYLLARVQALYEALPADDAERVGSLLERCGLRELLEIKLTREIGRQDNLEVWL